MKSKKNLTSVGFFEPERSKDPDLSNLQALGHEDVAEALELHEKRFPGTAKELFEKRVEYLFFLLKDGQLTPRARNETAKVWGISRRQMDKLREAAEMHLRLAIGDPEQFRAQFVFELRGIVDDARHAKRPFMTKEGVEYADSPDLGAAVRGIDTAAKMLGLYEKKPKKDAEEVNEDTEALLRQMRELFKEKSIVTEGTEGSTEQGTGSEEAGPAPEPERRSGSILNVPTGPIDRTTADIEREDYEEGE